jgi:UDP-MurNAc hydroxylase
MKTIFLSSSTVIIESNNTKILMDPWLLDGEYYGSWYHYPSLNLKMDLINSCDFIYVSHIHPDHFSKKSMELIDKHIPVLIHNYSSKFLKFNLEKLGFKVTELENSKDFILKNDLKIKIIAADNCNPELCSKFFGCAMIENDYQSTQIDSMALIYDKDFSILNTNDCPYELSKSSLDSILNDNPKKIDLLLVGYAGAGPYPQCFIMSDDEKYSEAKKKENQFLNQGIHYIDHVNPKYFMPFAGTYILGGYLSNLNKYRGVPNIEAAIDFFNCNINNSSKGILLRSYQIFDLDSEKIIQLEETDDITKEIIDRDEYLKKISLNKYDFESDSYPTLQDILNYIPDSFSRFKSKKDEIKFNSETKLIITLPEEKYLYIDLNENVQYKIIEKFDATKEDRFVKLNLDFRLLLRILKGPRFAHWNNAEIGSHITFERKPNLFERGLYHSYCFFHS